MSTLIVLGLIVGLDNLRVGIGIGTLDLSRRRRWQLALAFGLCEALMPLAGVIIGAWALGPLAIELDWLAPAMLAICGLLVLVGALLRTDTQKLLANSRWLLLLPLIMSIDNFMAGGSFAALHLPLGVSVAVVGLLSAALSLGGLWCGTILLRLAPQRPWAISASAFLMIALLSLLPRFG